MRLAKKQITKDNLSPIEKRHEELIDCFYKIIDRGDLGVDHYIAYCGYNGNRATTCKDILQKIKEAKDLVALDPTTVGGVSYAPNQSKKLDEKARVKTSIRRYIRRQLKILPDQFSDFSLDVLGNAFNFLTMPTKDIDSKMKFYSGKALKDFYNKTRITSCMTGNNKQNVVDYYAMNPKKVSVAVYDNKARALFWACDDGTKVLDVCYPHGSDAAKILQEWARRHDYVYQNEEDHGDYDRSLSDGKTHSVTMLHKNKFPSVDTFHCGRVTGKNKILVSNNKKKGDHIFLVTVTGDPLFNFKCIECGHTYDIEDTYDEDLGIPLDTEYKKVVCFDCIDKHFEQCTKCNKFEKREKHIEHCKECKKYGELRMKVEFPRFKPTSKNILEYIYNQEDRDFSIKSACKPFLCKDCKKKASKK